MKPRALLSCYDKTDLAPFARGLSDLGYELLSTGKTASLLRESGIDCRDVSEVTGFPEVLGGRVKTLHPAIHAGILARDTPDDEALLARLEIGRIRIVAVNLYPFTEAAKEGDRSMEDLIELIDIGGPTLLRAAAKNHGSVLPVVHREDYAPVLDALRAGEVPPALRRRLAASVFLATASYDACIAARLGGLDTVPAQDMPLPLELRRSLRYGENPHQAGAWYELAGSPDCFLELKSGKELSFNNISDLDSAYRLVRDLGCRSVAVLKHGNPCGAATGTEGEPLAAVYERAHGADPKSAFGSIVALSEPLDEATADRIAKNFVEVLVVPEATEEALKRLARRKNLRIVKVDPDLATPRFAARQALGGFLVQEPDRGADPEGKVVTKRSPTETEWQDLRFSMLVCRHVRSNAIVLARDGVTRGIGAGQMSRVDAAFLAAHKAGDRAKGSVMASDAFFPFPDGVEEAAKAGVTAVIQPGGSVRDAEVIEAADKLGLAMVFTGRRHFRH